MNSSDEEDPFCFETIYEIGDLNVAVTRHIHPNNRSVEFYIEGSKAMSMLEVAKILEQCMHHITISLDLPLPPQQKDRH